MEVLSNKKLLVHILSFHSNWNQYILSSWQSYWVVQVMTADLVQVYESYQNPDGGSGVSLWNSGLLEQPDVAISMRRLFWRHS
jgi:hypothetical protein